MSNTKYDKNSTKICSVCGFKKPLSEFIIDPLSHIKQYSDTCKSCRGKTVKKILNPNQGDGGKQSGSTVDAHTKIHAKEKQKLKEGKEDFEKKEYRKKIDKENEEKEDPFNENEDEKSLTTIKEEGSSTHKKKRTLNTSYLRINKKQQLNTQGEKHSVQTNKPSTMFSGIKKTVPTAKTPKKNESNPFFKFSAKIATKEALHKSAQKHQALPPEEKSSANSAPVNKTDSFFDQSRSDVTEIKNKFATSLVRGSAIIQKMMGKIMPKQEEKSHDEVIENKSPKHPSK